MKTAYWLTVSCYFALFSLLMLWYTRLAPSQHFPVALVLLISVTPLLLPLRGVLYGNPKSCAWVAYISLLYIFHGIGEGYENAAERLLAILETVLGLCLFFSASFYVRLRKKSLPE